MLIILFSGCAHTGKREAVDRLQGVWITDWTLTEPLMEQAIKDVVARNPKVNEESLRETLTEFHKNQRFEFNGNQISTSVDMWGTFRVVRVKDDRILIREFYEGFEEYTEINPQKLLEEFTYPKQDNEGSSVTIWHADVPLITGIEFIDDHRIRIYKLEAEKGKVAGNRNYEHAVMKKID